MVWNFTFELMPDEVIIDDSTRREYKGIKPVYSVFLTNRRVLFRFEGLGSILSQSLPYNEIIDVGVKTRLFISYLYVKTAKNDYLFQTYDADHWAEKIRSVKETIIKETPGGINPVPKEPRKRDILDMLVMLRKYSLLSEEEFEEKVRLLDSMKL